MPFNGSGQYSIPNGTLATSGQTILVSQHNPFVSDVEAALNQAFLRTGTAPMLANLNMNTFKIIGLANGTNPADGVNFSQLNALDPLGVPKPFFGAAAPTGYLLCYGQAVSRTTYAALFAAIGTVGGAGDGSTTFNIPDLRGIVLGGKDNMGGVAAGRLTTANPGGVNGLTLGATGGNQVHQLSIAEMPAHAHNITDPGHSHTYNSPNFVVDIDKGTSASLWSIDQVTTPNTNPATTGISILNNGGGGLHNNVQPTVIVNYILRTGI